MNRDKADAILKASTRAAARYKRDHAEFKRLLDAGDVDAARALANSEDFRDSFDDAISSEVGAAPLDAKETGVSASLYHAVAGHLAALTAKRWGNIRADVLGARVDKLEKRLAELESKPKRKGAR